MLLALLLGCQDEGNLTVCSRKPAERVFWKSDSDGRPEGSVLMRLGNGAAPVYCGTARLKRDDWYVAVHDGECFSTWYSVRVRGKRSRLDLEGWSCESVDTGLETGFIPIPF